MRKRLFLMILVVLVCFASFYVCEAGADTETEETLPEEVNRPEWKIGDEWEHKVTYIMKSGEEKEGFTSSQKVLKKEEFEGIMCYVLSPSARCSMRGYYTFDLNVKGFINKVGNKVLNRAKYTPDTRTYNWPLKVGKKWEQSYTAITESRGWGGKGELKERKNTINAVLEVVGVEKVKVAAGEFLALRIIKEVDNTVTEENWYSPKVKWFIKRKTYQKNDMIALWELVKYKVK